MYSRRSQFHYQFDDAAYYVLHISVDVHPENSLVFVLFVDLSGH